MTNQTHQNNLIPFNPKPISNNNIANLTLLGPRRDSLYDDEQDSLPHIENNSRSYDKH